MRAQSHKLDLVSTAIGTATGSVVQKLLQDSGFLGMIWDCQPRTAFEAAGRVTLDNRAITAA
jgi:hypothetical protein